MTLSQQVAKQAAQDLKQAFGGRYPDWEEFKEASRTGRVRVNKTLAAQAVHLAAVPPSFRIVYGYLTLWTAFLLVPIAVLVWWLLAYSAWWILGAILLSWYLIHVSRDGHCEGVKVGAERSEEFYHMLARSGAFLFEPRGGPPV